MSPGSVFLHVLLALTVVVVTGRVLSRLFAFLGQPPIIGEVFAGIVLGPSLLGPEMSARLFPPATLPYIGLIAQLGVVLYMFILSAWS